MGSLNLADSDRGVRVVRLTITVGLAILFLTLLLCGVRAIAPAHADPNTFYVDATSGSDMGMDPSQTVLAAYQAWHGLPWHAPAPYTSTDPIVISNHITAAQAQGIDGFVVDWYGPPDGLANDQDREFINRATAELLQESEGRGFYVSLMYDEGTISASGVPTTEYQTRVISDLLYARRYFTMPAYMLINGHPALFIFPYDDVDPYIDWTEVRNQLGITVTLFDKDPDPDDPGHDAQFDGFYAWVQPTGGEWSPDCTEWGEGYLTWFYNTMAGPPYAEKGIVGGVWPGFDDSLASWGSGRCMSRRCGQTWRDTWRLAEQHNPPLVMIDTWNDFEEGTDIEFGIEHCVYLPLVMRNASTTLPADVQISDIEYNPPGDDLQNEYVRIENTGGLAAYMANWTLSDVAGNTFTFPPFTLHPGASVHVWTKAGVGTATDLYWGRGSSVWDSVGDCAYLRNSAGTQVDSYCECEYHTASMSISATATNLEVGDIVTVTTTLFNEGCVGLGLPQYRLYVQSGESEPIFDPATPEPVVHYLAVGPGKSDAQEFVLRAINPGEATLSASTSFEVHLGYPGPAYWGYSTSGPLTVTVAP